MDHTIRIDDWDYSKDEHGNVYLFHWCSTRLGWRERAPMSSTRTDGKQTQLVCRYCLCKAPPEVDGFVNLLDWDYV